MKYHTSHSDADMFATLATIRCQHEHAIAIVGHPVSQSLSPAIYDYWFKKYNIDGVCITLDVEPEGLESAFIALMAAGFTGAAFTVPHKVAIMELTEKYGGTLSESALATGAVNIVKF